MANRGGEPQRGTERHREAQRGRERPESGGERHRESWGEAGREAEKGRKSWREL